MRLLITDIAADITLENALRRYHTLLQMTFASNIYKVIETPTSQIYRFVAPQTQMPAPQAGQQGAAAAIITVKCGKCQKESEVQANLGKASPLQAGKLPFPSDNKFKCPSCGTETDLALPRQQLEAQTGLPIIPQ